MIVVKNKNEERFSFSEFFDESTFAATMRPCCAPFNDNNSYGHCATIPVIYQFNRCST
jgi:hypothetical protein